MTVSNSTKQDLINWGIVPENITVINNGVNILKTKKSVPKDRVIIYLGSISKDKGIEDAIRIFSLINKQKPEWKFWVVGPGGRNYVNYLKQLSRKLGIKDKVKFWGFVSEEKKFDLLSRALILINPSIREGWGLVVIEAAAVGTPTVGYNVPGLRDSVRNGITGILSLSKPESCAGEILSLIADEEKYKILSRNCINWSKGFNWKKSSEKSLYLLRKMINKK